VILVLERKRASWLMIALLLSGAGCFTRVATPELALIYNRSARHHGPDRNPIIVIPGILGSKLWDRPTGTAVWGAFEPGAANPEDPDGARQVALPIRDAPLAELRDEVESNGVLDRVRVRLMGVPLEVQAYAGILRTLGAGGYRDEALGLGGEIDYGSDHYTCFQFDYDWRRDNVENARRLHDFIEEKRAYVQAQHHERFGVEDADVRFDIAAHSMGGLVTRYFLMYGDAELPEDGSLPTLTWAGAPSVERVILIGTPNAGALDALLELVRGKETGPLLPFYPPALLGTFPSIYQLLPRARHEAVVWADDEDEAIDALDPAVWEDLGWGLAAPNQDAVLEVLMPGVDDATTRREVALATQRRMLERARAFHQALDRPATAPPGLEMFLIAGDAMPTPNRVSVDRESGAVAVADRGPGDGIVPRTSALLDERVGGRWEPRLVSPIDFGSVLLLPEEHLDLTMSEVFRDNVLFWLLEDPRP